MSDSPISCLIKEMLLINEIKPKITIIGHKQVVIYL